MTKITLIVMITIILATGNLFAQLKVGNNPTTINANSALEIESTNKGLLLPRVTLAATTTVTPLMAHVQGMIVYNTATVADVTPGYYYNDGTKWVRVAGATTTTSGNLSNDNGILVTNGTGATLKNTLLRLDSTAIAKMIVQNPVKDSIITLLSALSIPAPAVFKLNSTITDFLGTSGIGGTQSVPMIQVKNSLPGLIFNPATSRVTIPPGTYQFTFTYEGTMSNGCTLSSYFVDFPFQGGSRRIHSTSNHNNGGTSNHGGSITFTTVLTSTYFDYSIHLGRGQSGNCIGTGMSLAAEATQFTIYRLGN